MEKEEENKTKLDHHETLLWLGRIANYTLLRRARRIRQVTSLALPPHTFRRWLQPSCTPVEPSSSPTAIRRDCQRRRTESGGGRIERRP